MDRFESAGLSPSSKINLSERKHKKVESSQCEMKEGIKQRKEYL